ncbi:ROK family transcriptional regulator [Lapidilactobacillus bayanensis]|uniref:ROK family transcriptional regulator n=1 Tax=Lapidilactobacillus bayanensis TaxID=2485998 RepID=UPI000F76A1F0|nr:ROK family transcriptional regulator [Lapidilactobacillus bayanensis]
MEIQKAQLRNVNQKKVLEQIFNHKMISRSQIAKNLSLSKVTVSEIVARLMAQQYICELGKGVSSSKGGRKPTILQINANYGFVLSFDLEFDYIEGMLALVNGEQVNVIHQKASTVSVFDRIAIIERIAEELIAGVQTKAGLLGISIAVHGIVVNNKILYTPYINFKNIDLGGILTKKFMVPVILENEANLSAVYERDFQSRESIDNLVCVSIHKGIGAGIILNNRLYTGIRGEAGEIGHAVVFESGEEHKSMRHSIEESCSEDAIVAKISEAISVDKLTHAEIKELYDRNNQQVRKIMSDFCFYTASIIHNLIVSLDPKMVIINSNLISDIPQLLQEIKSNILYLTDEKTQIILSKNSRYSILLGGISVIIGSTLEINSGEISFMETEQG